LQRLLWNGETEINQFDKIIHTHGTVLNRAMMLCTMATIISIVSYPFLPAKVGGQKGIALFNKYFARYNSLVCVATKKNDPSCAEGYEVLNILSNSKFRYINIFYFFLIRKIIKQKKASHLMLEHPYYGWLGVLIKKSCGVKLIVHSHNMEGLRWKTLGKWWWKILWQYEKFTHRQADYNFFIHDDDREYAIKAFGLTASKCITMTYGIEWEIIPPKEEIKRCKDLIKAQYHISGDEKILFFNGAFNYNPNAEALQRITDNINPLLLNKTGFRYKIIICGRDIPAAISNALYTNIIFAGFVDDVSIYFKASDIFLNPITEGGGIKTKLVEALGYNLNAVSTKQGAIGIDAGWCNGKLLICANDDWYSFSELIINSSKYSADIPEVYFDHFYWAHTTKKAAAFIA
jgi:glycosyltransferase involved in cell wall biosynthesis